MSEILPKGEPLRKAVKWISERLQGDENIPQFRLVEEACMKFNLSPTDAEFLERFLRERMFRAENP